MRIHHIHFDPKWVEILNTLLLRDTDNRETTLESADVVCVRRRVDIPKNLDPNKILFYFDASDRRMGDYLNYRPKKFKNRTVYFKLQVFNPSYYAKEQTDDFAVVSWPMLLGGASKHVINFDEDDSWVFSKNFAHNYETPIYDYSFIGNGGNGRNQAIRAIKGIGGNGFIRSVNSRYSIGHGARANRVPFEELIRVSRQSKACFSLNGNGPWCLKDGELLSRNCFIIRQDHPIIKLNPLTPKHGKHWIVAQKEEFANVVKFYSEHERERNKIRNAGHEYFKVGVLGEWAAYYTTRLKQFVRGKPGSVLEDLLIRG